MVPQDIPDALGVPLMNIVRADRAAAQHDHPPRTRPTSAPPGARSRGVDRVRLGDDGEVLVGQPRLLTPGYHRRPSQTTAHVRRRGLGARRRRRPVRRGGTADAFDGRRDERFATAYGTNIDPVRIRRPLRAECPSIAQACVIGDARPHLVALITLQGDPAAVAAAVERVNAQLPGTGRIHRYLVLEDTWAPGSDELDARDAQAPPRGGARPLRGPHRGALRRELAALRGELAAGGVDVAAAGEADGRAHPCSSSAALNASIASRDRAVVARAGRVVRDQVDLVDLRVEQLGERDGLRVAVVDAARASRTRRRPCAAGARSSASQASSTSASG